MTWAEVAEVIDRRVKINAPGTPEDGQAGYCAIIVKRDNYDWLVKTRLSDGSYKLFSDRKQLEPLAPL